MTPATRDAPRRSREPATADEAFRRSWGRRVSGGLLAAVALHFAFFQLFPELRAADFGGDVDGATPLELPPEVEIPPPPEEVARPATPTVPETEVAEDVTIAPTDGEALNEVAPPPPSAVGADDREVRYIPRDVEPRATNDDEIRRLLERHYPAGRRAADPAGGGAPGAAQDGCCAVATRTGGG